MVDPGSIERRIDGKPAMKEHDDRHPLRFRIGWLEQPVRPRAFSQLVPHDQAMGIEGPACGGRSLTADRQTSSSPASSPAQERQHGHDHGTGQPADHAPRLSHPWRAWHVSVPHFSYPELILESQHK